MTKKTVKSVCPYCGVGCGILLDVVDNRIVKVSGDKSHPTNFGRLCTKGSTCGQPVATSGRADKAYARIEGSRDQGPIPIEAAIDRTASGLRAIIDAHGPDAVSFYVSGQMSLEAQYLANKLCKGFIGTNNIESNSRLCMASAASGYKLSIGADGPPGSYQDFDKADLFFVIGANMADCHPILFLRMMDRVKQGARLIVVDPRRNATADKANLFLQIKPGTDLALLNGLLSRWVSTALCCQQRVARILSSLLQRYRGIAAKRELSGTPAGAVSHRPRSRAARLDDEIEAGDQAVWPLDPLVGVRLEPGESGDGKSFSHLLPQG